MNSMENEQSDSEMEKLTKMLSSVQNLYHRKREQLEELKDEILDLKEIINLLNSIISTRSFHSADEIYSQAMDEPEIEVEKEDYFNEEAPKEKVEGTKLKRKIFEKGDDQENLLCVLNFYDFNDLEIKFVDPPKTSIKETSDDFISTFLRGALLSIKERNPNLDLTYEHYKNTDVIQSIKITNLNSMDDYDLITSKIRELLTKDKSF
ncbi:MAG: hypothetical protein BAJALOKI2v1_590004 [Promethearchaeota archaeon]|nr:MAG: hypothetical protein BAJALOKI2v1_590004 [Candidatus Lokiarchaeota archaeon]